jgi:hypothetical protein
VPQHSAEERLIHRVIWSYSIADDTESDYSFLSNPVIILRYLKG